MANDDEITFDKVTEEFEANNSYRRGARDVKDPHAKKVMNDIADEELVHSGELLEVVDKVNPHAVEKIKEGYREAKEMSKSESGVKKGFLNTHTYEASEPIIDATGPYEKIIPPVKRMREAIEDDHKIPVEQMPIDDTPHRITALVDTVRGMEEGDPKSFFRKKIIELMKRQDKQMVDNMAEGMNKSESGVKKGGFISPYIAEEAYAGREGDEIVPVDKRVEDLTTGDDLIFHNTQNFSPDDDLASRVTVLSGAYRKSPEEIKPILMEKLKNIVARQNDIEANESDDPTYISCRDGKEPVDPELLEEVGKRDAAGNIQWGGGKTLSVRESATGPIEKRNAKTDLKNMGAVNAAANGVRAKAHEISEKANNHYAEPRAEYDDDDNLVSITLPDTNEERKEIRRESTKYRNLANDVKRRTNKKRQKKITGNDTPHSKFRNKVYGANYGFGKPIPTGAGQKAGNDLYMQRKTKSATADMPFRELMIMKKAHDYEHDPHLDEGLDWIESEDKKAEENDKSVQLTDKEKKQYYGNPKTKGGSQEKQKRNSDKGKARSPEPRQSAKDINAALRSIKNRLGLSTKGATSVYRSASTEQIEKAIDAELNYKKFGDAWNAIGRLHRENPDDKDLDAQNNRTSDAFNYAKQSAVFNVNKAPKDINPKYDIYGPKYGRGYPMNEIPSGQFKASATPTIPSFRSMMGVEKPIIKSGGGLYNHSAFGVAYIGGGKHDNSLTTKRRFANRDDETGKFTTKKLEVEGCTKKEISLKHRCNEDRVDDDKQ